MTAGGAEPDSSELLRELPRLALHEREQYIRKSDDAERLCIALAEQLEKLTLTDLSAAAECGRSLVQVADALDSTIASIRARRAFAQALAYANRFDEAISELLIAIDRGERAGHKLEGARARLTMIHPLARLGRLDEALQEGETARQAFLEANEASLLAKASANLGVTLRMLDDPAAALARFDEAAAIFSAPSTFEPAALAQVQSNCAEALLDLHRFAEAEAAFGEALQRFEEFGAARAAAIVEGNLADLASRQGRMEVATELFERAAARFEESGKEIASGDVARLRAEQAEAFATIGASSEAITLYDQALPLLRASGLVFEEARAMVGKARALLQQGRQRREPHLEAMRLLKSAGERFVHLKRRTGGGRVRLLQGELSLREGEMAEAKQHFAAALELLSDRPVDAAAARIGLAKIAIETDNPCGAEAILSEAHGELTVAGHAPALAEFYQVRARLRFLQRCQHDAIDDLRRAVDQVERVRGLLQAARLRNAYLASQADAHESLILALLNEVSERDELTKSLPIVEEAFRVCEQSRSRSLLDVMAGVLPTITSRAKDSPLVAEVVQLHSRLNALYATLEHLGAPEKASAIDSLQEIEECEERLGLAEARLTATQSQQNGSSGVGGLFAPPRTARQIAPLLPRTTALIEYFVAADEVLAFVLRSDESKIGNPKSESRSPVMLDVVRRLATREELAAGAQRFDFQLNRSLLRIASRQSSGDRTAKAVAAELDNLHALFVQPLLPHIEGADRLIIVPHGPLHGLPLHAGLIHSHDVAFLPSASLLAHLARAGSAGRRSLIVGVSPSEEAQQHSTYPPLNFVGQEVSNVGAVLSDADVFLGDAAIAERVKHAVVHRRLIHLACHGRFASAYPMASGLRLADRWLTVRELYGLTLDGAVVTLSACDTGRMTDASPYSGAAEPIGLHSALLAAGARSLLSTLWPIHDEFAAKLMASIYKLWQNEGKSPAAALREVQLRLRNEGIHPVLWAPVIVTGAITGASED